MGDTLQYLLGAGILGVFLTQVLTMWRERHDHRRERNGLLRILFSEIYLNQTLLDAVGALYQANMPMEHRMKAGRRTLEREHMYKETWEATSGLASVPWFFRESDEPRSGSRPGSKVSFHKSCRGVQHALPQQVELSSPVHRALNELELVHSTFGLSLTVR